MRITVWVSAWEQACCGVAFAEGAEVTWMLVPPAAALQGVFAPRDGVVVEAAETHHGGDDDDVLRTTGTVESIHLVHVNYSTEARPRGSEVLVAEPGTARLTRVRRSADPRTAEMRFLGFLVVLRIDDRSPAGADSY